MEVNVMKYRFMKAFGAILMAALIFGCSGPEAKKLKFFSKGKALYEKGDMAKAGLEFKNAIQIDPKYADAYYMLGMVDLAGGRVRDAYGRLLKATELNPALLKAQVQLG